MSEKLTESDLATIRGKKIGCVSLLANRSYSLEKLEKEISKCEVRCANCHRIKTRIEDAGRLLATCAVS